MTEKTTTALSIISREEEIVLEKCIVFLNSIGIKTVAGKIPVDSFLPGLSIRDGSIIYDVETLKYPGDILHEAGHIAIVSASDRQTLSEAAIAKRENREAEEMMAIAWSYAACIHLQLDPHFVFHDKGYKGGGSYIADNFTKKQYFGLPMLQWKGMAADEKKAVELNIKPYPAMIKWLLD